MTLVADGDPDAGLGHLARCTALAAALVEKNVLVRTLAFGAEAQLELDDQTWEPLSAGTVLDEAVLGAALVLDTYDDTRERRALAAGPSRTVVMVDTGVPPPWADLVVGLPPWPAPPGGRALTGLRHACLRREYWATQPRSPTGPVRRVLVTTGGTDPGDFGGALSVALRSALSETEVTLIRGPATSSPAPTGVTVLESPASLHAPLMDADVVVTAAGQSMLEALALGTPAVVAVQADNQRPGARLVAEQELAIVLDEPEPEAVVAAVTRLAGDLGLRSRLASDGQAAVDGHGALRVAEAIAGLMRG